MKKTAAIMAAKLVKSAARVRKTAATAVPGYVAERIDPGLLKKLGKINFPDGVVLVTGTNGKTTTTKVLADVLRKADISFVNNHAGSNLSRGVISSILTDASVRGFTKARVGLFEVDEAYVPEVAAALQPKMIVVTNLFRDQLDRYGELDSIANKFRQAFKDLHSTTLVLNADDPLVASLGMKLSGSLKVIYFGVSDKSAFTALQHDHTADSIVDPFTGEILQYQQKYFGHIGRYKTKSGKFGRPQPQIDVLKVVNSTPKYTKIKVKNTTELYSVSVNLTGNYNIYNVLPAFALAQLFKIDTSVVVQTLANLSAAFGRTETMQIGKINFDLYLIKNPTGFNQVIQSFIQKDTTCPLVLAINDDIADGRDVSWLWDCAVEDFSARSGPVIVTGSRALDMQLRLVYAGYKGKILLEPDEKRALKCAHRLAKKHRVIVLPTYTAMLTLRKLINQANNESSKEFWQ